MSWLTRLLSSSPPSASVSRRGFVASAGALAAGTLIADDAQAASEPALVDADGLPIAPEDRLALGADGRPGDEPFIGTIMLAGFNFAPRGWAFCNGQLLPINQYQALFSILGTIYGGDGRTTFGLPDLRGRVPIHEGQGSGLSPFSLGSKGGTEAAPLTAHTHPLPEVQVRGTGTQIVGYPNEGATGTTVATSTTAVGGSDNVQPTLAVNFVIALEGLFPSRS